MPRNCRRSKAAAVRLYDATVDCALRKHQMYRKLKLGRSGGEVRQGWRGFDASISLNSAGDSRILIQGSIRSDAVVVMGVRIQNPTQMRLAQNNHMIDALAPDRSFQPLGKSILPRRRWCGRLVPDAHGAQSACDNGAVDPIAVPDHITRSPIPRKCLGDLACATHSAVGLVVTLIQTRSLRSIRTITKPYSSLKPMVGTTNKSMAAMSGAWFRKKVFRAVHDA
jgi:hypothetical protein